MGERVHTNTMTTVTIQWRDSGLWVLACWRFKM